MSADGCLYSIRDRLLEGRSAPLKPANQLGLDEPPEPPFSFAQRMGGNLTHPRPPHKCAAVHAKNLRGFLRVQKVFTVVVPGLWRKSVFGVTVVCAGSLLFRQ